MQRGEVLVIPGNVINILPVELFCRIFNAHPGNNPSELVVTKGFHVHNVWTQPRGETQSVNIDIVYEGDNAQCKDTQEDNCKTGLGWAHPHHQNLHK